MTSHSPTRHKEVHVGYIPAGTKVECEAGVITQETSDVLGLPRSCVCTRILRERKDTTSSVNNKREDVREL
jgi:hypothetical protein